MRSEDKWRALDGKLVEPSIPLQAERLCWQLVLGGLSTTGLIGRHFGDKRDEGEWGQTPLNRNWAAGSFLYYYYYCYYYFGVNTEMFLSFLRAQQFTWSQLKPNSLLVVFNQTIFITKHNSNMILFFLDVGGCVEGRNFYFQFFLSTVLFFVVKLLLWRAPHSRCYVKGDNTCNVCKSLGLLTFSARIVIDDTYHWPSKARHLNLIK